MAFRVALPLVLAAVSLTDAFLTLPATGSTFVKLAGARSCSPLEGVRRPCAPTLALRRNSQQPLSLNMASPLGLRSKMAGAKKVLATTAMALSLSFMGVQSARAAGGATMYEDDLHEEVQVTEVMPEETDYTGMRTLKFGEQVIKYGMLAGGFGGFLAYSMWEGKRADRDEETRVAEEVDRIEKWKAEFIDMEDVASDDDLLKSFNKRTSGEEGSEVKDLDGTGKIAADYDPEAEILKQQMGKMAAAEEKKQEAKKAKEEADAAAAVEDAKATLEDKPAEIDAAQMERLKRMFGGGDAAGPSTPGKPSTPPGKK